MTVDHTVARSWQLSNARSISY